MKPNNATQNTDIANAIELIGNTGNTGDKAKQATTAQAERLIALLQEHGFTLKSAANMPYIAWLTLRKLAINAK